MRSGARALAAGVGWLLLLFTVDALDSLGLILGSIRHIRADAADTAALQGAVADYVARILCAYLLMGLAAGVLLHLVLRLRFARPPAPRTWWAWALGLLGGATLWGTLRQMITTPPVQDLWPWLRDVVADALDPWQLDLFGGVLAAALLGSLLRRWRKEGGDLRAFGGRLLAVGAWVGLLALLTHTPAARVAAPNAGPNVVIIGIDSLRPDHLGSAGYHRDTAPHIDALLADSVRFDRAYTSLARTYPSWVSLLSGQLPIHAGIRDNLPSGRRLVPPVALLPQQLKARGWRTAFGTDDSRFSYMVPELGWDDVEQPELGLQNFVVSANEPRFRAFWGLLSNPLGSALVPVTRANQAFGKTYHPARFERLALDQLARASEAPRFLYAVHSCVLHAPGDRVWPWHRMYGQRGYEGPNRFRYARSATDFVQDGAAEDAGSTPAAAEQDTRIYDAGIAMADDLVRRVVASLRAAGTYDDTLIVLLSDHGEELWAPDLPYRYGSPNHGFHVYGEGQNRVLLAFKLPGGEQAGRRVDAPVRLLDVAPTVLDALGLPQDAAIDGRSLLPLARGAQEEELRPVYIETGVSEPRYWVRGHRRYPYRNVSERFAIEPGTGRVFLREEFLPQLIAAKDRAVVLGRWKLVWHALEVGTRIELFDVDADPHNRVDLSEAHPDEVLRLGRVLAPYLLADGEDARVPPAWRTAAGAAAPEGSAAPPATEAGSPGR
jgi:arylsulfatase A-like enzyme